jgi:hypothetical protein
LKKNEPGQLRPGFFIAATDRDDVEFAAQKAVNAAARGGKELNARLAAIN